MKASLVYLVLFKCYYTLAQNSVCTFETVDAESNICDPSNHFVYVSEMNNGCRVPNTKCWCVLIDNRNRVYDGDMVIELVQIFNADNVHPEFGEVKSYIGFEVTPGTNRIIVQQPEMPRKITSIKIREIETCKFTNTSPELNDEFQIPTTNNDISSKPSEDYYQEYVADCMHRNAYTEYSHKYCPNYRPEFMIEKRTGPNNQIYWCIVINNDNYSLTSANHLQIVYSPQIKRFNYSPINAYIAQGVPGSYFHLGNRRTTIAISQYHNQLANLDSVNIDNYPICSYFEQRVTATTPATTSTELPSGLPLVPPIPTIPDEPDVTDATTIESEPNPQKTEPNDINPRSIKNCGIKPTHKNSLISFGSNTMPGDWPWHAAIYKLQGKINRNFICGGTLIDVKTIVTAAHCVMDLSVDIKPERLTVELGRHDLTIASVATQEYRVYDVITHEAYNTESFENDIAILVLANYVQLTRYVNFVCLPIPNENLQNQIGTTVGWGFDQNNELQSELKEASLPVVDNIKCLISNREFFGAYLTKTNYCAGFMNKTNVCRGDSGGGLVFKSKEQWFLGGITSIAVSLKSVDLECDLTQYVLFTDVTKFVTWIKQYS